MVQIYPLANVMLTLGTTLTSTCQHYISQRVKLDHFGYFKGKIVPGVSLGCPVVQGGYLNGKIGSLPFLNSSIHSFFFKQKTAYEILRSDWSSDVCSSDLKIGNTTFNFIRAITLFCLTTLNH